MKYNIDTTNVVDPLNYIDKPLWCVYGYECFPSVFACTINSASGTPVIWGYSVYKRSGGYRTLGLNLDKWIAEQNLIGKIAYFFNKQEHAMEFLSKLITPTLTKK
jgi:hypothetical protein